MEFRKKQPENVQYITFLPHIINIELCTLYQTHQKQLPELMDPLIRNSPTLTLCSTDGIFILYFNQKLTTLQERATY